MLKKYMFLLIVATLLFLSCEKPITMGDLWEEYNNTSDNFPHSHDGLDWSDASSDDMYWDEAITYCKNLGLGGRLPTISELRMLIQNCPGTETGGECGVTDSCLSGDHCLNKACDGCEYDDANPSKYSVFGDTQYFWSSSELSDYTGYAAWGVNFLNGAVGNGRYFDNILHVRCVR